jgi:DNA-binding NarL/FixJ family response regulator
VSRSPRVLLADEQPTVRAATRRALEADGISICAEANNALGAVEAALRERPDLCLIAPLLPGDGIRAAAEIASALPSTRVVMLSASDDCELLFRAIRAGAVGYLLKDMSPVRLPAALRGVLAGEAAIPRTLVAALVKEFQMSSTRRTVVGRRGPVDLTPREWEVLELVGRGLSTTAVAKRLLIAPSTVRRHLSSAVKKLEAGSREEAAAMLKSGAGRQPAAR